MQTRNNNIINEISYFCTLSNSFVFCGIEAIEKSL